MTPLFPARRAAEEFDQAITGSAPPDVADRYAGLLATVETLRAQPEVEPRPEFVSDLRTRLLRAAETDLAAAPGVVRRLPVRQPAPTSSRGRRLGTAAAALVIIGGGAGMAAAASGSLPGDPLYPVKRGIEGVGTAVHTSDAGKGESLLDHAATRLEEVRALQAEDSQGTELVTATLDSFRDAAVAGSDRLFAAYRVGGDQRFVTTVRDFTDEQMSVLAALAAATDDPALTEALRDAADTVATIDQQARVLCAACGPRRALDLPSSLLSSSSAGTFEGLLVRPVSQVGADLLALRQARDERLRAAAGAAQDKADELPRTDGPGAPGGSAGSPTVPVDGDTVTSLITRDGRAVPVPTPGAGPAVDDLVANVTGDLDAVTGPTGADKVTGGLPGTGGATGPVEELVEGPTGPLDDLLP